MAYIYFITNYNKEIKIGYTIDLKTRLENLQVANSNKLQILYLIEIEESDSHLEHHIHHICTKYHIKGEWYHKEVMNHLFNHPWYKENIKEYQKVTI